MSYYAFYKTLKYRGAVNVTNNTYASKANFLD